jgi:hypothetical protein
MRMAKAFLEVCNNRPQTAVNAKKKKKTTRYLQFIIQGIPQSQQLW